MKRPALRFNHAVPANVIAGLIPQIIRNSDSRGAYEAVSYYRSSPDTLPEMFMLFNTLGLSERDQQNMLLAIAPGAKLDPHSENLMWSHSNLFRAVGRLGYSFPLWRFPAQSFPGGSLFERYGLERLHRPTDLRDESLPPGHPNRDHFGTGYIKNEGNWYFEFRRAYIVSSQQGNSPLTIVVRNNSFFFGRDRLQYPAYVSFSDLSADKLKNLSDDDFQEGGVFTPLHMALNDNQPYGQSLTFFLGLLLDKFDQESIAFHDWLFSANGKPHLESFMNHTLARQVATGKDTPPFYISRLSSLSPPWFPKESIPATTHLAKTLEDIAKNHRHEQIVLLSGQNGDFPLRPEPLTKSAPSPKPTI